MNSQTRTALDRLNHQFELDVMLVQEYQLWATWLSYVPVFVPNVENVHVSFRILLTTRIGRDGYSGFHGGDGGPPGSSTSPIPLNCTPTWEPSTRSNVDVDLKSRLAKTNGIVKVPGFYTTN